MFRIFVEQPEKLSVKLDGQPFPSGSRARFGKRTLTIESPETEPIQRNFRVWFKAVDLGDIYAPRSKGTLEVRANPVPKHLVISGPLYKNTNTNAVATFLVPVGDYTVNAAFEHSIEQRRVQVHRNETSRLEISPALGTLKIVTEPKDAEFRLAGSSLGGSNLEGSTPAELKQLPVGSYNLRVWRNNYVKDVDITVNMDETNEQNVIFEYGEVEVLSNPEGASIVDQSGEIGKTPKKITNLKPGRYPFQLRLAGYYSVDVNPLVTGKQSVVIRTNLINVRYAEAMQTARSLVTSSFEDYQQALARIEEALQAQPGDAAALTLKDKIVALWTDQERKVVEEKQLEQLRIANEAKKAALDARKREAEEIFRRVASSEKDADRFETMVWPIKGTVANLRQAFLRMLKQEGSWWELNREAQMDERRVAFSCRAPGFMAFKTRRCLVLLSEMEEGEVCLHAKFFEYSEHKTLPLQSSYTPVDTEKQKAVAEEFRRRLITELTPQ